MTGGELLIVDATAKYKMKIRGTGAKSTGWFILSSINKDETINRYIDNYDYQL